MKTRLLRITFIFFTAIGCINKHEPSSQNNPPDPIKNQGASQSQVDNQSAVGSKYSIEQLDNANGLSNSSVNTIFQDSENLLWIGTWDGLNRYDGNHFKIFRPELNNENSLSNQVILKIDEDSAGQIWVLTMHGLNRYDKKSNTFKTYYFSRKDKPPFSESEFNMALDGSKNVFCAVKDWGIGYFDGKEFRPLQIKHLPNQAVKKMAFMPNDQLLLLFDNNELFSLKIESRSAAEKMSSQPELISNNVADFEIVSSGQICFVKGSGNAILYSFQDNKALQINTDAVHNIIHKTKVGVLLNTASGYFIIDSLGKKSTNSWVKSLKNQKITTLLEGTENVIWTGTDGDGLFKMYPLKKTFNLVSKSQIREIDGSIVRAFLEVEENSFWIGTKGSGLFKLPSDFYENVNKPIKYQNFNQKNSGINNAVFALFKGNDDLIFIGTDGNGISVYDLKKSKFFDWSEIIGHELCSYFKSTYAIYQDDDGYIWVGTNGYGMIAFKISRSGENLKVTDFKQYLAANKALRSLSSNIVFSIVPRNKEELWIGTRLGGLNLFNKTTNAFKSFKHIKYDSQSLSNNDILSLHTDSEKRLWVGTSLGLNLLKEFHGDTVPVFQNFTVKEGLPNNTIHGIVSDKNANLW
ncbi:MAG: two-component regulator propeller domain-containing protein, partial [Gelidibacter sp.]